ncbi:MAG: hypothetical protein V7727_11035 [Sneathiella sp.]
MTGNDPYFTLCEAVTWIAYRTSYFNIDSLAWALKNGDNIDLGDPALATAEEELMKRLSHPKSGIFVMGCDENGGNRIDEIIPHNHFLADIELCLFDNSIGASSKKLDNFVGETKIFPKWERVKLLKEDILREWPDETTDENRRNFTEQGSESKEERIERYTNEAVGRDKKKFAEKRYYATQYIIDNKSQSKAPACRYAARKLKIVDDAADNLRRTLDRAFGSDWNTKI